VPANVEIIRKDSSMVDFVNALAGARFVVIPLLPGIATQAGIGVYLQAMAARKCVVISSGPGVSDVLDDSQAIIVPAGDVSALREAIRMAWEDPALRERYGLTAAAYALSLGGEDQLRRSVLASLPGGIDAL
jgi:glycosyltransferase involved in cell wall biosynthesis